MRNLRNADNLVERELIYSRLWIFPSSVILRSISTVYHCFHILLVRDGREVVITALGGRGEGDVDYGNLMLSA